MFKAGFKNPPGVEPVPGKGEPEMLDGFQSVVQRVKEHPGDFHPSPFASYLDPPTRRELHIVHCSHHLGFLISK